MAERSLGVFVDQLPCRDQVAGHGVGVGTVQSAEFAAHFGRQLFGFDLGRDPGTPLVLFAGSMLGLCPASAAGTRSEGLIARRSLRSSCPVAVPVVAHSYPSPRILFVLPDKGYGSCVAICRACHLPRMCDVLRKKCPWPPRVLGGTGVCVCSA